MDPGDQTVPGLALRVGLDWFAKSLPLTHALALMRYGLVDRNAPAFETPGASATRP